MKSISVITTILSLSPLLYIPPESGGGGNEIVPVDPGLTNITHPLISTGVYGPFDGTTNPTLRFQLNRSGAGFNAILSFYYYDTGTRYGTKKYDLDEVVTNNAFDVSFVLKNRMANGVSVRVSTEYKSETNVKSTNIVLYPTTSDKIYSYNYRNTSYNISNRAFKIENNAVYTDEKVNFKDTIDYLTNDIENAIDVSEISFTHISKLPLNDTSGYLYIEDEDNSLFPNLEHSDNGVKFPIKAVKNSNDVSLVTNFTYYYNKLTLAMAKTKLNANFISTKKIYIKKTMMSSLENKTIYVRLPSILKSGTTIEIPLQFIKDKNFVGLCSDSNHCIIGGIKE